MQSTSTSTAPAADSSQLLAGLNPEQRAAVITTEGPVLIVAGPGSGKTRVLTVRVAYMVRELGVAPWQIMAVTFTNKAAREMRERIEALVGEKAKWATIGTFHAFCARTLRQHGGEIGIDPRFVIYDDTDQLSAIKRALETLDINPKQFSPRAVLSAISKAKSHGLAPAEYARSVETYWEEIVARVYPVYQETLLRRKALDFDDLLLATVSLVQNSQAAREALQRRHRYIMVDEYQDTNRVQYALVRELSSEHRNLCVVGDPDQSIYGWRAADNRNILTFKEDYPDAVEIHLEENYRSTPEILSAADAVIKHNTQRIDRALRTGNASGARITVRECFDEQQEARFVVDEIIRLEAQHGYSGSAIAVLYRTNSQSRAVEEAFIRAGIPYQLIGGTRFYERKEIKDALALLRLIGNPDDAAAFERVVAEFPAGAGLGQKSVADLERWMGSTNQPLSFALTELGQPGGPPLNSRAIKLLGVFERDLTSLRALEPDIPLSELFDRALDVTGYRSLFESGDPELADCWENVLQLRANLERYDDLSPETRLSTFLEEVALVSDVDQLDSEQERVTLITLHAVKGLEFAVVFITGVEEGLIPHQRSISENPEMLEEERRLFYVGITRAKERLYLTHAFRRTRFSGPDLATPSSFLAALPPDTLMSPAAPKAPRRMMAVPQLSDPVAPPVVERLHAGQSVFHTRFGEGVVAAVADKDDDQEVTVEFKRHGTKRLLASMANLSVDLE
jgi:DNA helicase-2/ATP-dependent DNA helicase PcrA